MHRGITRRHMIQGTVAGAACATLATPVLAQDDLPNVRVGSFNNTEQLLMAELVVQVLEDAGFETEQFNLAGTFIVHEARNAGDIDVHVEYTGTGLTVLEQNVADLRQDGDSPEDVASIVFDEVKRGYEEQWNAIWLEPFGFNNTYAMGMRETHAEELGIESISDLKDYPGELVIGAQHEFIVREDGIPGMQDIYGIEFQDTQSMESGLMYAALDNEDVDIISAYSTDGRIQALNIRLLEDDLGFFPPYHAAPVVRQELLDASPEVADVINRLAGKISDEQMQSMNFRVDDGGEEPRDVARDFLTQEGLLEED